MDVIRPNWDMKGVSAFTTTVSNPWPVHWNENPEREKNVHFFTKEYMLPAEPYWLKQTHSNTVVEMRKALSLPIADASVAREHGQVAAILTADCLPILLASEDKSTVCAVHAGWRGLATNIIEKSIYAMGIARNNIQAWIGPCIHKSSFEVQQDFLSNLISHGHASELVYSFSNKIDSTHWHFDLVAFAEHMLVQSGLKKEKIYDSGYCTYAHSNKFHSHRKSQGKSKQRLVSLIWID
jgi:hypothetical protein